MRYDEQNAIWYAEENCNIRRKSDGMIMGKGLQLGENDYVENYEEVEDLESINIDSEEQIPESVRPMRKSRTDKN